MHGQRWYGVIGIVVCFRFFILLCGRGGNWKQTDSMASNSICVRPTAHAGRGVGCDNDSSLFFFDVWDICVE